MTGTESDEGLFRVNLIATPATGDAGLAMSSGLDDRLVLTDATGVVWPRLTSSGGTVLNGTLRDYQVTYRKPDGATAPAKLRLLEYRSRTQKVPFEFKDIPLP